jgi:2-succinyl-5-enolpyruvyl-6-hydroxy-3-cyclohexene-1-carboxylate synthase
MTLPPVHALEGGAGEAPNLSLAWAGAVAEELVRSGVRHAVVSPGSRSAPLALAFAAHPGLCDHAILDERSAAFFALGLARATRAPVALACTSGTAAANYLPAVVEAHHAAVPLVLLTADRPPELRDCGAGQTIDQVGLYGRCVRFAFDAPSPSARDEAFRHLRVLVCRAVACARAPSAGPAHLNLPFVEPLAPIVAPSERAALRDRGALARDGREGAPFTRVDAPQGLLPDEGALERLAGELSNEPRGWIAAGPLDAGPALADALRELAGACGWPVLADALSQLRTGPDASGCVVDAHDALLRDADFVERAAPRAVLRFGALPTSKAFRLCLEARPGLRQWVVDPAGWSEPTSLAAELVRSDPLLLCRELAKRVRPRRGDEARAFRSQWVRAGSVARGALCAALAERSELDEPGVATALASALADGATLFVASSMPVRDVDAFWPRGSRRVRFLANRGANGIDGTLSTALGVAQGTPGPCAVLLGDLALLHDLGGLLQASRSGLDLLVVVVDNDGGGIFELLPVAEAAERAVFERHFATPQRVDLARLAAGFGLPLRVATSPGELAAALATEAPARGVRIVCARCDRRQARAVRAGLQRGVSRALAEGA